MKNENCGIEKEPQSETSIRKLVIFPNPKQAIDFPHTFSKNNQPFHTFT